MTPKEWTLFTLAEEIAKSRNGHLTVVRSTTNWRVTFMNPSGREVIDAAHVGKTLEEALGAAIAAIASDAN